MPKTLIKSRYKPKYKLKPQSQPSNPHTSSLPPNLQNFKDGLLSGSGFITYK